MVEEALRVTDDWYGHDIKAIQTIQNEAEEQKELMEEETDLNNSRLSVMTSMVMEYIKSNFMNEISMSETARAIGYSEPYFCKMFKQQFGQSFTSYLAEYRWGKPKRCWSSPMSM